MTTEKYNDTVAKLVTSDKEMLGTKDQLMHLDEELNYMEQCNDRHKQNQDIMNDRLQRETTMVHEQSLKQSEAEITLSKQEKETEGMKIEIEGLRCSTEELYIRKQ